MTTTTRSPGATPSATNPADARRARPASSWLEYQVPSKCSAGWSGKRSRASSARRPRDAGLVAGAVTRVSYATPCPPRNTTASGEADGGLGAHEDLVAADRG